MDEFKLLIAEDEDADIEAYRSSIEVVKHKSKRKIELVECKTVEDALHQIDGTFDGAIIDLRLADQGDEGNRILQKIRDLKYRIPVAMMTGTPENVDQEFNYIDVYKKGEVTYETILNRFFEIYDTGITRIMGGRGKIEEFLDIVFQDNLLPQLEIWEEYGKTDSERTQRALLRYTLNHLVQMLDEDSDSFFPEEVYIYPPLTEHYKTGSIVANKDGKSFCVILSPACDLVLRETGQMKTDQLLLVGIDNNKKTYGHVLKSKKIEDKEKVEIVRAYLGNRCTLYHHWLPQTKFFTGGFVNFRKLASMSLTECKKKFAPPHIQITSQFVKDILSRFSSYYARQGQPEIDHKGIVEVMFPSSEGAN